MVAARLNRFRRGRSAETGRGFGSDDGALLSTDLMASLQRLSLHAPSLQRGTFAGEHRSRRHGSSPEFADYRRYSPGDDIRRVDWNLYARFDELFVRLSEVTTDLSVHFLIDSSSSMDWASRPELPTKHRFATQVAAALGYTALWHFDRLRVTTFAPSTTQRRRVIQGRTRIPEMLQSLSELRPGGSGRLADHLASYGHHDPDSGMLLVFSDLLSDDADVLSSALRRLRSRGWQVVMAHVLDPAEREPEELFPRRDRTGEPTTLIDAEVGTRIMLDPSEASLAHYRSQFGAWERSMAEMCRRNDVTWAPLQTDSSLETVVLAMLNDHRVLR